MDAKIGPRTAAMIHAAFPRGVDEIVMAYFAPIGESSWALSHAGCIERVHGRAPDELDYVAAIRGACEGGHAAIVDALFDASIEVDYCMRIACAGGHEDVARVLLEYGACPRIGLRVASEKGHFALANMLRPLVLDLDWSNA